MRAKYDPVTVAEASEEYEREKPNNGQRITLKKVAKRYGLSAASLYNFRRGQLFLPGRYSG